MHTNTYTLTHTPCLVYDRFPSLFLPPFAHSVRLFFCCRERTGVNHYRQYRLKMQSPPGAQGHWRPMGDRKSPHMQMCTRTHSQPTRAVCKQSADCLPSRLFSTLFLTFFNLTSLCQFNLLSWYYLDLSAAWCGCDVISFHFLSLLHVSGFPSRSIP